jgi:hypothetical protein
MHQSSDRNFIMNRFVACFVVGLITGFNLPLALAGTTDSVSVEIQVLPVAFIEFPYGSDFLITVPKIDNHGNDDHKKHGAGDKSGNGNASNIHDRNGLLFRTIRPVFVPFSVRGNAQASISVAPDRFVRIREDYYLGKALKEIGVRFANRKRNKLEARVGRGRGNSARSSIGYNIFVQFPVTSEHRSKMAVWSGNWPGGLVSLPGLNGHGTPPLPATVSMQRHGALGMIYVIARDNWTENGKQAAPGNYRGAVQVTVMADE